MEGKGLIMVITGDGKGKTTSALGMLMRTAGHDKKACMIQFMKSPDSGYGEVTALNRLNVENYQVGAGFTWRVSPAVTIAKVNNAWELAKEKMMADDYDLIVLDEFNIALSLPERINEQAIEVNEVLETIKQMQLKYPQRHLVMTGLNARPEILEIADLISEINCIKHPFKAGIPAQPCVEF